MLSYPYTPHFMSGAASSCVPVTSNTACAAVTPSITTVSSQSSSSASQCCDFAQCFFHNAGSGTFNISPQGSFVVNIHCAGARSEFDEFDRLVQNAKLVHFFLSCLC